MSASIRAAALLLALFAFVVLASCSAPSGALDGRAASAKPAPKPTAAAAVFPGEASAPVLARYFDNGSNAAGEATIVKWEWNFGGGWEDHSVTAGEVWKTYAAAGSKTAHLRVTDSSGQTSVPRLVRLTVRPGANAAPVAVIGGIATTNSTNFDFSAEGSYDPDGTIVSWEWDFDSDGSYDFISLADGSASHSFPGGDHTVTLRVTDDDGATATATVGVHGNFPPVASIEVVEDAAAFGVRAIDLSFAGSSDVEGPLYDAYVSIGGNPAILWDINEVLRINTFAGDPPITVILTVRDGLWATGTAMASVSFEDGAVLALP